MGMYSGFFVVVFGVESRLSEIWKRRKKKKHVCLLIRMCVVKQPILHISLILTLHQGMNMGLFREVVQS